MIRVRKSKSTNKSLKPTNLVEQTPTETRSSTKLSAANDLQKLSNGNLPTLKGIQFRTPSNTGVKSSSSGSANNEWTNILKTSSSGVTSLIGGGFLESGVNSLISGLTSLFGGSGKAETALAQFALPDPQEQTMYVASGGLSTSTNSNRGPQSASLQGPMYKQADIVQAVKNALLTSSSLNDVIAEI